MDKGSPHGKGGGSGCVVDHFESDHICWLGEKIVEDCEPLEGWSCHCWEGEGDGWRSRFWGGGSSRTGALGTLRHLDGEVDLLAGYRS